MTRRYPAYKDSGVEWLGEVPSTWEVTRVKTLFEIKKRIVGELGHDVLSVTQNGIRVRDTESNDGQVSMDYSKYQIVEPNDFVMNHMDLLTGYVDISQFQGVTSPDYRVFTVRNSKLSGRYFLYLFQNGYRRRIFYAFGQGASEFGRWRMPTDNFNNFEMPLPPLTEQTAIAAFLDRETAKIDALVAEQRRLIDLLREKRQAVISHAVTKGLNPNAPLKPSGIDWLGDVPEGWEVVRLRNVVTLNPSKSEVSHLPGETEVSFLPMEAVGENGELDLERTRLLSEVLTGYTYFADGDVTYAKITPCFENGKGARMRGLMDGFGFGTTELTVLRPDRKRIAPEFLECVLSSPNFRLHGEGAMYGAGGQKRVPDDFARDFIIGLPSLEEQREIVAAIDKAKLKFDSLTAIAETGIALLQERRAALISAAVTGKIDVRHLSPAATEAA